MKVSVIIPVFNGEKFLEKAITSALEQSETGEVLLVDDKSTDTSLEIAYAFAAKDKRVRVLQHPDKGNHGTPATRNLGIINASCDFIAFLDNDDFYLPGRFSKAAEIFANNADVDGVYEAIGTYAYDQIALERHMNRMKHGKKSGINLHLTTFDSAVKPEDLFHELLTEEKGWLHFNGITLRRSAFDKAGMFDKELVWDEDTELILRLAYFTRLVAGRLDQPVAMRGVYLGNRTLSTEGRKIARRYHVKMWEKMFNFMLANEMSSRCSRIIFMQRLNYYNHEFVSREVNFTRKMVKLSNLVRIVLSHPKSIKRIL